MKHTIPELFDYVINSPFVVGAAGAITSVVAGKKIPWWRRVAMGIAGTMSAGFLSPAICAWIAVDKPEYRSAIAFAVGMLGLQIVAGVIKLGEDIKKNPSKYIPQRWKK